MSTEPDVWWTSGTPFFFKLACEIPADPFINNELFLLKSKNFLWRIILRRLRNDAELKQKRIKLSVLPIMTRKLVIVLAWYQIELCLWDPNKKFIDNIMADGPCNLSSKLSKKLKKKVTWVIVKQVTMAQTVTVTRCSAWNCKVCKIVNSQFSYMKFV